MKLSEFIHVKAESASVAMPCEVTPGHHSKTFVIISFEKVTIVKGEPTMARIELRVCPECFRGFAYDVSLVARDVSRGS